MHGRERGHVRSTLGLIKLYLSNKDLQSTFCVFEKLNLKKHP